MDRDNLEMFFTVYSTGVFFPIKNATQLVQETNASVTTVVGSAVLAATVGSGLNFTGLEDTVRIMLQLNELGVSGRKVLFFLSKFNATNGWKLP